MKKRSKLMKKLTDCGDNQHEVVRDIDSYGNSAFKCGKCGNRLYNKLPNNDGWEDMSGGGCGSRAYSSSNTIDRNYFSINKPIHIDYSIDYLSSSNPYINTPAGEVSVADMSSQATFTSNPYHGS